MSNAPPTLHLGEVWTEALPCEDPVLYGHAQITPRGHFAARSLASFTLTYRAGRYGLDDTGSIKIVMRFTADGGPLQTVDPKALNYVTAASSSGVPLRVSFDASGHTRPWYQALTVTVVKGCLREGDEIVVRLGDRSGGSPGLRLQSFCESAFAFKVLADVCATNHFVPVAESPTISIVPGAPARWKAVLPSLRRPGEAFRLGIKAEDAHGNPSDQVDARLRLHASLLVAGLPAEARFASGARALLLEDLSVTQEGLLRIKVEDQNGELLAESNPLLIREGQFAEYWGDMHGQSGESVGINTAREYFQFARDLAFLDATSHQANDFQVNGAFWGHINDLTAEFQEDGRFLTFPGYEWSGNTGVGGDRNVYFRREGRAIRRSSHALIADRSDIASDAPTARELFEALQDEDCVVYAHIGGRPADVAYAHDPRLETAMEIHSAWGTFEWLMADCFSLGHRVGVVANSDGHKGRPGASYPGASGFGAYGGLTCFLAEDLNRDAIFDCLRRRRHYASTGDRIRIDLAVTAARPFRLYERDPLVTPGPTIEVERLTMGDIAASESEEVTLSFTVQARAAIERVDILNAMEIEASHRSYGPEDLGNRIRLLWRGALVKGRGARAHWQGRANFEGCRIFKTAEVNAWNPDYPLGRPDGHSLTWESVTAGNFGAVDVWLGPGTEGSLDLQTNYRSERIALDRIGYEALDLAAGGLDLAIQLFRLPDIMEKRDLSATVTLPLRPEGDNPLWIRVTTEDGFQAWSSPIYLFRAG